MYRQILGINARRRQAPPFASSCPFLFGADDAHVQAITGSPTLQAAPIDPSGTVLLNQSGSPDMAQYEGGATIPLSTGNHFIPSDSTNTISLEFEIDLPDMTGHAASAFTLNALGLFDISDVSGASVGVTFGGAQNPSKWSLLFNFDTQLVVLPDAGSVKVGLDYSPSSGEATVTYDGVSYPQTGIAQPGDDLIPGLRTISAVASGVSSDLAVKLIQDSQLFTLSHPPGSISLCQALVPYVAPALPTPATIFNGGESLEEWNFKDTSTLFQDTGASVPTVANNDPILAAVGIHNGNTLLDIGSASGVFRDGFGLGVSAVNLSNTLNYSLPAANAGDFTYIFATSADTQCQVRLGGYSGGNFDFEGVNDPNTGSEQVRVFSTGLFYNLSDTEEADNPNVIAITRSGNTLEMYIDGVLKDTDTAAGTEQFSAVSVTVNTVNAGDFTKAHVQGVLYANRATTTQEQADLSAYFKSL